MPMVKELTIANKIVYGRGGRPKNNIKIIKFNIFYQTQQEIYACSNSYSDEIGLNDEALIHETI